MEPMKDEQKDTPQKDTDKEFIKELRLKWEATKLLLKFAAWVTGGILVILQLIEHLKKLF